ncbi:hypothetical protein B0T20DRAFT_347739 [Sordaria brevicollis]|uniref:Uncharacterized protein n=1 Tax=Sordaria brevicollis TaxID=83679 RepID=A0AAE0PIS4_SORBR|nr:hypothetical protein B0T20DRAFT_347739 [Sordaria brevicollis]
MKKARRLLEAAIEQQTERISLAKTIAEAWDASQVQVPLADKHCENNLNAVDGTSVSAIDRIRKRHTFRAWQIIGLSRLSLCYTAMAQLARLEYMYRPVEAEDNQKKAIQAAHDAVLLCQGQQDSSVVAFAHFFYGRALLAIGKKEEALTHFDLQLKPDPTSSKLPGGILVRGLEAQFIQRGNETMETAMVKTEALREGARLRKGYRELFQEKLRPVLMAGGANCLQRLRRAYAKALDQDADKERMFDRLKYVPYEEFREWGRLRRSCEGLSTPYEPAAEQGEENEEKGEYIIFFSYRWINKDLDNRSPDDEANTQYNRTLDAIQLFLSRHPEVGRRKLCIWMDFACVNQDSPSSGVAALPMILAQCDAVISLVGDQYHERAWCSVEALMIQTLKKAYGVHLWYEHVAGEHEVGGEAGVKDRKQWTLRETRTDRDINLAEKKLSVESDRPRVMLLEISPDR